MTKKKLKEQLRHLDLEVRTQGFVQELMRVEINKLKEEVRLAVDWIDRLRSANDEKEFDLQDLTARVDRLDVDIPIDYELTGSD